MFAVRVTGSYYTASVRFPCRESICPAQSENIRELRDAPCLYYLLELGTPRSVLREGPAA